jgi:transposase
MPRQARRQFSGAEKVAILKRHLLDRESIADLCDELRLSPNMFYRWQKTFFENGANAFDASASRNGSRADRRLAELEDKLLERDNVISELATELVKAKKNSGVL